MAELDGCVEDGPGGAILSVHVVPRASRSGVAGFHGGSLRVRVAAPPVEGAANRELLTVLASLLGVRVGTLELVAGTRGREKRVRVQGLPAEHVRQRLAFALSVDRAGGEN